MCANNCPTDYVLVCARGQQLEREKFPGLDLKTKTTHTHHIPQNTPERTWTHSRMSTGRGSPSRSCDLWNQNERLSRVNASIFHMCFVRDCVCVCGSKIFHKIAYTRKQCVCVCIYIRYCACVAPVIGCYYAKRSGFVISGWVNSKLQTGVCVDMALVKHDERSLAVYWDYGGCRVNSHPSA